MKNLFSRTGTAKAESSSTATATGRRPVRKPDPAPQMLHVPKIFENGGPVFFMSAAHRGDMYHFRAALQIENCSVVLYDSNHDDPTRPKTEDLEKYLEKTVLKTGKHIFVASWDNDQIKGYKALPGEIVGCYLDGEPFNKLAREYPKTNLGTYSERTSTEIIASAPGRLQDVINGMTVLSDTLIGNKFPDFNHISAKFPGLSDEFKKLWAAWQKAGVKTGENAILFMYRDTGTRDPSPVTTMGVYPELDNGQATADIERIIGEIAEKEGKQLTVFTCGLAGSGIGEYWMAINGLKPSTEITKRDFEAYFLKWSYENKYFKMATGFRSGPLDLFTFMGIPTVSIGLRNLMGEGRHQLLASEQFQRVNIQYDQPRHRATAAVLTSRQKAPKNQKPPPPPDFPTFGSPFWQDGFKPPVGAKGQRNAPQDKKQEQMQPPRVFAPFDRIVARTGYMIALQKYMGWEQTVRSMKNTLPCTVTTSVARLCFPFKLQGNKTALRKYLDDSETADYGDVKRVERKLGEPAETLQLSQLMFDKYEDNFDKGWDEMTKLINASKILGPQPRARKCKIIKK
ncbi:hypothetical protein ACQKWADRAFT_291699 [Trichoderma austrokoningii]